MYQNNICKRSIRQSPGIPKIPIVTDVIGFAPIKMPVYGKNLFITRSKINAKMLFMSIFKMNLNGFKNIFAHITETRSPNMHPTIVENSKSALPPVIYDKTPENLIAFGHLIFTYIFKKFGNITSIFFKNVLQ